MRILIHTQYFPPETGAPQNRLYDLACELSRLEHEIVVLTAMPNYPTGRIFPGYSGGFRKEVGNGFITYRTPIIPAQSAALLPRLASYFSFVISSLLVGLFLPRPDVIFTESPPLFLGISGYLLSRVKRTRWIFNVADLWPDSAVELGIIRKNSLAHRISQQMETFFYRKAWLVTGQSKSILSAIQYRSPNARTYHLSNGVQVDQYIPQERTRGSNQPLCVMYAGLHGLAQGLDQIITAAASLDQDAFQFLLVGAGPEKSALIQQARDLNVCNVTFLDPVPRDKMPALLTQADMIIVPLRIQLTGAVPSKLYEAMAAGKPIVLIAQSEAAEIVRAANCGLTVEPGDTAALKNAIVALMVDPQRRIQLGVNGRKYVETWFNRRAIVHAFSKFLVSSLRFAEDEVNKP
ncbi:MAG TPA: glycosyltransferase family 4 protein [Anaerolineaceae bacterium]